MGYISGGEYIYHVREGEIEKGGGVGLP